MGKGNGLKSTLLLLLLFASSALIYAAPQKKVTVPATKLDKAFSQVGRWKAIPIEFGQDAREYLQLDDYVFSNYTDGQRTVALYIGYYYSKKKLGAAHSPLVCFPGQGWVISGAREVTPEAGGGEKMPAEMAVMRVEKASDRYLAVYWFQSYDRPSSDTFHQKLNTLLATLTTGKETNAFIRVTVPIRRSDETAAYKDAMSFIGDLYPGFLSYVRSH